MSYDVIECHIGSVLYCKIEKREAAEAFLGGAPSLFCLAQTDVSSEAMLCGT